ncbi:hypothetical protein PX554_04365 [Sphingomonas sp. H39-1-10]|uniref:hypothetical protein n=1 Tax=Sphingomonas TaxID=13687 RepID=UPI0008880706|nr:MULTISPECIES: hypothetical protein [Sphingomonas]MDF0487353.1 hypothetical protein [Sphingomonas pollutisoli]SDA15669.1 hypothetical protein SAMN03159340_00734 [Sphingomonas sp. NFR15]
MSRTVILAYADKAAADAMAVNYANDYTVMVIGPTDQVVLARESEDGVVWRSGAEADFYVMIATKDPIAGPKAPG